jgi:putative transposase
MLQAMPWEPRAYHRSPGQRNVIAFARDLNERLAAAATIGDKGYDAGHLCRPIIRFGGAAVIPPKHNRIVQRPYDTDLYKKRNIVERFFDKLKQFRRVATRYGNLLCNFTGFVDSESINTWLT